MSKANKIQIGGQHYKKPGVIEHWDLIEHHGLGYLEGCATKYISRWRQKNGVEDLKKALHYTEKLIELHTSENRRPRGIVPALILQEFCSGNQLSDIETKILRNLCMWATGNDLVSARMYINRLIAREAGEE